MYEDRPGMEPGEVGEVLETYDRVGGWLLLLCVLLTIVNPLGTAFNLFYGYSRTNHLFGAIHGLRNIIVGDAILSVALTSFSVYAGWRLWKILPGAVITAKKYLVVYLIYNLAAPAFPFLYRIPEQFANAMFRQLIKGVPFAVAYFAVWYLYLSKSKRVRGTYGRHLGPSLSPR